MGETDALQGWKEAQQGFPHDVEFSVGGIEAVNPGTVVIRATGAESDALVGSQLAIGHNVVKVAEGISPGSADCSELFIVQGFSHHHHGMQRDQPPLLAGQRVGVAFGGQHDGVRCHAPAGSAQLVFVNFERGGLFVNFDLFSFDGLCQTPRQAGRVNRRTMAHQQAPQRLVDVEQSTGLTRTQPAVVLIAETLTMHVLQLFAQAYQLRWQYCHFQCTRLLKVAIDGFAFRYASDFPDGIEHLSLQADGAVTFVRVVEPMLNTGQKRRAPTAVAAGRAETGYFCFENGNIQIGIDLLQVPGSPQTGIARPDNGNVDFYVVFQRRPGL